MDKIKMILEGKAVIVSDNWLNENELPDNAVTIPNPKKCGLLDSYIAGLISNETIRDYRKQKGLI